MAKTKVGFFHPYPKYLQITDILRNRVLTQMQPGERILPEVDLGKQFGVSRETIRQALEPLEREGLITRSRGRGSFVAKPLPFGLPRKKLTGLAEDFVQGLTYRLIRKDLTKSDEEMSAFLKLERESFLVQIDRISILDDKPLAYHVALLPANIGMRVMQEDLEHSSIASLLGGPCGFRLEEDQQIIEAETADVQLAEHLGVPIGFPVLFMRRIYISQGELPIAYFKSYYRADRYMYTVALRQHEGHQRVVIPKRDLIAVPGKHRNPRSGRTASTRTRADGSRMTRGAP
jgi:GntR family transcriptional regulator